jgi:flagellar hook assembly protein FlgD
LLGQKITTLADNHQPAGRYHLIWNGRDSHGNNVASGIYFYKLTAGIFTQVKKMVLTR